MSGLWAPMPTDFRPGGAERGRGCWEPPPRGAAPCASWREARSSPLIPPGSISQPGFASSAAFGRVRNEKVSVRGHFLTFLSHKKQPGQRESSVPRRPARAGAPARPAVKHAGCVCFFFCRFILEQIFRCDFTAVDFQKLFFLFFFPQLERFKCWATVPGLGFQFQAFCDRCSQNHHFGPKQFFCFDSKWLLSSPLFLVAFWVFMTQIFPFYWKLFVFILLFYISVFLILPFSLEISNTLL